MPPVSTRSPQKDSPSKNSPSKHSIRKKARPFRMPTIREFLDMKRMYDDKKDPVWVFLEREMRENADKKLKPYNEKVGIWLKFLEQLRFYKYCQQLKILNQINKECGPIWYCELSSFQKDILDELTPRIHADILDRRPKRIRNALKDLGMSLRISSNMLMDAMKSCGNDAGLFIWHLYTAIYQQPPCVLKESYDINDRLLMSSLVFIDLKECIATLNRITQNTIPAAQPAAPKKEKKKPITGMFGEYQQRLRYTYVPPKRKVQGDKPREKVDYKFKLRTPESLERLQHNTEFIQKRMDRQISEQSSNRRTCDYEFFNPPVSTKNVDPKRAAYLIKLRMLTEKAPLKARGPTPNLQYFVGGVCYPRDDPNYNVMGMRLLPSEFVTIGGGYTLYHGPLITEYIPLITGFCKPPRIAPATPKKCDCLSKWEDKAMEVVNNTRCMCGHLYDRFFTNTEIKKKTVVTTEPYMVPPNKFGPMEFDEPLIYQLHPQEDFIRNATLQAVKSAPTTVESTNSSISAGGLQLEQLVSVLLADLAKTPLLIPHLPQANTLNSLLVWVRHRFFGKLTPEEHKNLMLRSERRWVQLNHIDFRARAYRIPFTNKQLNKMSWRNRYKIQALFNILLKDFTTRNRLMQLEQTRLWWSTMMYDEYPSKAFLDVFFTLMPQRIKDSLLLNPFTVENVRDVTGPACGRKKDKQIDEFQLRF